MGLQNPSMQKFNKRCTSLYELLVEERLGRLFFTEKSR
jgi:hypothetical protein